MARRIIRVFPSPVVRVTRWWLLEIIGFYEKHAHHFMVLIEAIKQNPKQRVLKTT
jgi:hypothetical protein